MLRLFKGLIRFFNPEKLVIWRLYRLFGAVSARICDNTKTFNYLLEQTVRYRYD